MVVSGPTLVALLVLLTAWLSLLGRTLWKAIKTLQLNRKLRSVITIVGLSCSMAAVGALLAFHLSWVSPNVSQHLGATTIRVLAMLLFWPTVLGFVLSISGSGRIRFLGVGTCIATGLWWLTLFMQAAISMGAPPMARHPTRYLVPAGYVGWITIKHGENAPALAMQNGENICRIPLSGTLSTSSELEDGWAKDEYFYYDGDSLPKILPETGWGAGGMIWGNSVGSDQPPAGSKRTRFTESFYVGTEDQYHHEVYGRDEKKD